ncbi:MAG: IS4 family transposase [Deferrisomatales bacterium]
MVVAWRVHRLAYQGRETPGVPSDVFLTEEEWKPLYARIHHKRPPDHQPTLSEAVWMIGKLGGHLGRFGDRPPGTMTLWRGLRRLPDIFSGWVLYRK